MRTGGFMTIIGAPFFLISIAVSLSVALALVSNEVGRQVSLGEFLDALGEVGMASIVYLGIMMQLGFFVVAIIAGIYMLKGVRSAPLAAIAVGIVGVIISFLLLGGITGAIGGILALVGGGIASTGGISAPSSWR
ncbi:MAG: hypothetical protein JSV43_05615 [Methanobacteriota archaeon]|nr:MAG: hypothetical protein JSV43_05615 [Euryarchaeota archaeon]